jgi:transposase-like protein
VRQQPNQRRYTTIETTNIVDFARRDEMTDALTDLLRTGAQQLIATAVEAEFAGYLAQFADLRTETGHAAVIRNGHHPERPFQTGIGPVSVRIPKVQSKDGQPVAFRSALVPPYVRRTKTLEAALPWLYLKGISSGEMAPALKVLLGPAAKGLSADTVSRLKRDWAKEYDGWREAELDDEPIVYIWADGVHSGLRGEDDAEKAFDLFIKIYEPKYPKAALCLQKDRTELMAFFDLPAQHWQSIRTSNPIESAFATIRHRTKRSKGCLSRDGMLHMMFKLGRGPMRRAKLAKTTRL